MKIDRTPAASEIVERDLGEHHRPDHVGVEHVEQ